MNTLARIKSSVIKKGYRVLTVLQFGAKTAYQIAPFGDDSLAIEDMVGVYSQTSESGESVFIGYMNPDQISLPGEKRIFSLKSDGSLATAIHLKNDGTIEMGQAEDYAVKYTELKKGFDKLTENFNSLVSTFNSHVHVSSAPGSPNAPTITPGSPTTASIDSCKIETIKVS